MRISRRYFLASAATIAAGAENTNRGRVFPSTAVRYLDPATEFSVVRLTDPQFTAYLPLPKNRATSQRAILYASDFGGKWDAYRMDLKSAESRKLTEASALDPSSLGFLPNERGMLHFDNGALFETQFPKLQNFKTREVYRTPVGFEKTPGVSYGEDGQYAAFVERSTASAAARNRLQLVRLTGGRPKTLMEASEEISDVLIRPRHTSLYFRIGGQPALINFDGSGSRRLKLADGETGQTQWVADGHALLYLSRASDAKNLTAIREFHPESQEDSQIARTSQYVHFHSTPDGSMFVGSSGSKASPYVLLLSRAAKREFTLAEHRATDSTIANTVFTANIQAILFLSDRHGKPAIYFMPVDKLVSENDGS